MDRRVLVGIAIALVLLGGAGIAVFDLPSQSEQTPEQTSAQPQLALAQIEQANETLFRVSVFENGDARWTVKYQQRITDDAEVKAFREFAEGFETEQTETFSNFQQRADRLTEDGTEITNREMNATEFQRNARYSEISRDGVIEMSFRWVGFAEVENEQVIVSDVFDGGFVILEDQRLRIERGEALSFDSVSPDPDEVEVTTSSEFGDWVEWDGYREFEAGGIDVRLSPPTVTANNSETPQNAGDTTTNSKDANRGDSNTQGSESSMIVPLMALVLVILGTGGMVVWYTMSRSSQTEQSTPSTETPTQPSADQGESEAELETKELLSDEDRVLKLLEDNGGRMRQVSIVEETEWSKSKVSMLLSDMESEGEISKLRVGRENIISLAGEEPEAAGSPFDDEG
jgi:flagellar basal body-associated protein FliL